MVICSYFQEWKKACIFNGLRGTFEYLISLFKTHMNQDKCSNADSLEASKEFYHARNKFSKKIYAVTCSDGHVY